MSLTLRRGILSGDPKARVLTFSDPARGIQYNSLIDTRRVSWDIFSFDIARSPQVVRNDFSHVDVQGEAVKLNRYRPLVDYKASKARGR